VNKDILKALEGIAYNGPTRVVVNSDGEAKPPMRAKKENEIKPDVIFVRNDGWSLGAPIELYDVAEKMWAGDWVMVIRKPFPKMDGQERLVVKGVDLCH
jgi:hypothetical protein